MLGLGLATVSGSAMALVSTRREYDAVSSVYVPVAIAVFAIVVLAIAFVLWRYRRRPGRQPARWSEHNRLEAAYAGFLVLVVGALLFVTFSAEHKVDTVAAAQRPSLTIDVIGAKWEWQFTYPRYGITQRSGTVGDQPLMVPTDEPIAFELGSPDVIHSFWIPTLRFKRDLIPGSVQRVILTFTMAGVFPGQCAEFCGLRHADMVFSVQAVSPARFAAWAAVRAAGRGR